MSFFIIHHRFQKAISLLFAFALFFQATGLYADQLADRVKELAEKRDKIIESINTAEPDKIVELQVHVNMIDRQVAVGDSYVDLKSRVDLLNVKDPRKVKSRDALKEAEKKVFTGSQAFLTWNVETDSSLTDKEPYQPSLKFNQAEKEVIALLSQVNRQLLTPVRPGTTTKNGQEVGGVPQGDIIEDFIPGVIRLLFRFVTLVIFISFLVSGVMFITAFGNDDRLTKARHILYYSLIGFAITTLAFAIVKAVTDIDFFGFI